MPIFGKFSKIFGNFAHSVHNGVCFKYRGKVGLAHMGLMEMYKSCNGPDKRTKKTLPLCNTVKTFCETLILIQSWWSWLEPILTSLEAQFVKARQFDFERYSAMLKQGERKIRTLYNM